VSTIAEIKSRLYYEEFLLQCIRQAFQLRQAGRSEEYLHCVDGIITYLIPKIKKNVRDLRSELIKEIDEKLRSLEESLRGEDPLRRALVLKRERKALMIKVADLLMERIIEELDRNGMLMKMRYLEVGHYEG